MLFTQLVLPLLPIASAISLHGLTRRAGSGNHAQAVQALQMRNGESSLAGAAGSSSNSTLIASANGQRKVKRNKARRSMMVGKGSKNVKRLVRSKKRACTAPSSGSTSPSVGASATSSPTSVIGDEHIVPSPTASPSATTASPSPSASPSPTSYGWDLTDTWAGNTFFDNFDFWNYDDPTHGTVDYQDAGQAWNQGLVSINERGNAMMYTDTTQYASGRGRKAVRLHGKKVYTGGLVLMDSLHMPTGCGTWPAWWSNGPNWPYGGEIDILEGVNEYTQNQVSLHTGSGCTMPPSSAADQTGTYTTGWYDSFNCASYETSNSGCGVRDQSNPNTYGKAFNDIGGGVYALLWAKEGIKFWFFPRSAIPADITADTPNPQGWGTPVGNFPSDNCNPYQFFYDHFNIFTNTFCGDWAGSPNIWNYAGWAGQDKSCAAITGYSTCDDYVRNVGSAFQDAYWEVQYVKYFNSTIYV